MWSKFTARFSHSRRLRVTAVVVLVLAVTGPVLYARHFPPLPQASVYLFNDVAPPHRGQRLLVFSPHPDDETIGVGGYIAASIRNGASVSIVLVTDGNKHGLEVRRYSEFSNATALLGVAQDNLTFLNYPDGGLAKVGAARLRSSFEPIVNRVRPEVVLGPHPKDTHPDHALVGKTLAALCAHKHVLLYQYLVHYPRFPYPKTRAATLFLLPPVRMVAFESEWRRFLLSPEIERLKQQAVAQYRSQLRVPVLRNLLFGLLRRNELLAIPESTSPADYSR